MLKKLRGRNLAHPGCLVGVTLGLTLGLIMATILAFGLNVNINLDLAVWFGLTLLLGALGWVLGDRLSSRFTALGEEHEGRS
jgi:ABC-type cobalamin transport system permease subunit